MHRQQVGCSFSKCKTNTNFRKTLQSIVVEADVEVQKAVLQTLSAGTLVLPIVSTQVVDKVANLMETAPSMEMVNFILGKLANQGAIVIRNVTIGSEAGYEVISVQTKELQEIYDDVNDSCQQKQAEIDAKRKCKCKANS